MNIKDLKVPTLEERLAKAESIAKEAEKDHKDYLKWLVEEAEKAIDGANGNRNKGIDENKEK